MTGHALVAEDRLYITAVGDWLGSEHRRAQQRQWREKTTKHGQNPYAAIRHCKAGTTKQPNMSDFHADHTSV